MDQNELIRERTVNDVSQSNLLTIITKLQRKITQLEAENKELRADRDYCRLLLDHTGGKG